MCAAQRVCKMCVKARSVVRRVYASGRASMWYGEGGGVRKKVVAAKRGKETVQ